MMGSRVQTSSRKRDGKLTFDGCRRIIMRMRLDVAVVEFEILQTVMENVDESEIELGYVTDVGSTLKEVRPLSLPVDETRVVRWRELLATRVRRRESVVATDHLVPARDESAEVFVVVSVDTVSEKNDRAASEKVDDWRDLAFGARSPQE